MIGQLSYNATQQEMTTKTRYQRTVRKLEVLVLTRSLVAVRARGLEIKLGLNVLYS